MTDSVERDKGPHLMLMPQNLFVSTYYSVELLQMHLKVNLSQHKIWGGQSLNESQIVI